MMRRIVLRRIPKDPLSAVYESDEFELDSGPMLVAVVRGKPPEVLEPEVLDLLRMLKGSNPENSVVVVSLGDGEDFELWEETT